MKAVTMKSLESTMAWPRPKTSHLSGKGIEGGGGGGGGKWGGCCGTNAKCRGKAWASWSSSSSSESVVCPYSSEEKEEEEEEEEEDEKSVAGRWWPLLQVAEEDIHKTGGEDVIDGVILVVGKRK